MSQALNRLILQPLLAGEDLVDRGRPRRRARGLPDRAVLTRSRSAISRSTARNPTTTEAAGDRAMTISDWPTARSDARSPTSPRSLDAAVRRHIELLAGVPRRPRARRRRPRLAAPRRRLAREFTRHGLARIARQLPASWPIAYPLIKRGLTLRTPTSGARASPSPPAPAAQAAQDVNAVVQAFLRRRPSTQAALTGAAGAGEARAGPRHRRELFLALFTRPAAPGGCRSGPPRSTRSATSSRNPEDRDEPWFYLREYDATVGGGRVRCRAAHGPDRDAPRAAPGARVLARRRRPKTHRRAAGAVGCADAARDGEPRSTGGEVAAWAMSTPRCRGRGRIRGS